MNEQGVSENNFNIINEFTLCRVQSIHNLSLYGEHNIFLKDCLDSITLLMSS